MFQINSILQKKVIWSFFFISLFSGCTQMTEGAEDSTFPALKNIDNKYSFVLIADPQVAADRKDKPRKPSVNLSETVEEINKMVPAPAFVLFNGDLVGRGDKKAHTDNFVNRAGKLEPLTILVHGNHDGHPPYTEFQEMQFKMNGTRAVDFSFDCGEWHYVAFPCNIDTPELERQYLKWLDNDLKQNKDKPTMVFVHYHLLPQGLTQLEWYTYPKAYRKQVVDTITKYGNVKYCFFGHVHNGIKAAVKTAWNYKGTKWITAPTCTMPRNFGEEYADFESGQNNGKTLGGGYYLVIDIEGKNAKVKGRLNDVEQEYLFPDNFKEYKNQEPLWFKSVLDYPINSKLKNGGFEDDLDGWMRPYRYLSDDNPGFIWKADTSIKRAGDKSAYLFVREKGQTWAREEMMELYQLVKIESNASPVFNVSFFPQNINHGGGYIRLCFYNGREMKFLMLFDWGNGNKPKNMRMSANSIYTATGLKCGPDELAKMGSERTAMFLELAAKEGKWHDLVINIANFYDSCHLSGPKFKDLGIDKLLVAIGVWCQRDKDSQSETYFDEISLTPQTDNKEVVFDGQSVAITNDVFKTTFGSKRRTPPIQRQK